MKEIWDETAAFMRNIAPEYRRFGWKIANGPPHKNIPILFIGYQPGGGAVAWETERETIRSHLTWPTECEYAIAKWRLAKRLQQQIPLEILRQCPGTNAHFIRWPHVSGLRSVAAFPQGHEKIAGYKDTLPSDVIDAVRKHCADQLQKLVDIMNPTTVIAISKDALQELGSKAIPATEGKTKSGKAVTLAWRGEAFGRSVLAVHHLSAQLSSYNLNLIGREIRREANIAAPITPG